MKQTFITLALLLLLFTPAFAGTSSSALMPDTLLSASVAKNISLRSNDTSTSITVTDIDNTKDNFYYEAGRPRKVNRKNGRTHIHVDMPSVSDILIAESDSAVTINFNDADGNPRHFSYLFPNPENRTVKTYIGKQGSDFGFTISRSRTTSWDLVSNGLGIGWVTPVNVSADFDPSMGRSVELSWLNVLGIRFTHRASSLTVGLGLNWKNFVTKGDHYFQKESDGSINLVPYAENETDRRSRIKIFSLQLPVLYGLRFGHNRDWGIKIGPVVNFNTSASIKTQYKIGKEKYSIKTSHIGQRPVTVDAMFTIHYKLLGIYARYSPMTQLRMASLLDFGSFSTGISIGF